MKIPISGTQVEIYFGPVKNVAIYIYDFIITCMLHVYTLYTLHNTLNNDNCAKKWNALAIERGGPKIMTGSHIIIGTQGPHSHGVPKIS